MVTAFITGLIIIILVFFVSAIPLYIAVHILGGKASFLRAALINIVAGLLIGVINGASTLIAVLTAILLIIVYRQAFRLKWWKAIIVWFVQMLVAWLLAFLAFLLFDVAALSMF